MNKLFFVFALFSFHFTFAQSVTVSQDVNIRSDNGYEILGRYKGNVLLFRDKSIEYSVSAFDDQMRIAWEHNLVFPEKKIQILDAVGGSDYFAILYKAKEKNNNVVKVHRFDASAKFIDSSIVQNLGARFNTPNITSVLSENKKMALVYSIGQNSEIDAAVFDIENMKLVWDKKLIIPDIVRNSENFREVIADNDGNVYFIFEQDESASIFGSNKHDYIVFEASKTANVVTTIPVKEFATYEIRFDFDNINKQLCGVGLFSDLNKSKPTGCFFLQIKNATFNIFFDTFSDEIISILTDKKVSTNKGVEDLKPQNPIFRKDGGVIAFFEQYKQFSRAAAGMNTRGFAGNDPVGRFVVDYYCDNVLAVSFNPNGTVQWKKVLPKKQYSQDDDAVFSSYGVLKTPRELRILFNDEARTETTTSEYILTGDGRIDRHSMFNTTNQDILIRFKDITQLSADEVVAPSESRSKLRLVRLRY